MGSAQVVGWGFFLGRRGTERRDTLWRKGIVWKAMSTLLGVQGALY